MNKKNIEDILALTPMQEGLLFHYLKDRQGESYFNQLNLEVSGEIDLECFEKSWNLVIETNEMLRTVFRWEKLEKPTQVVLKKHTILLKYEDISIVVDSHEQNRQWKRLKQQDRSRQFDLREVPFRVTLCKMAQNHYHILISNHHILYDGWSTGIVLKEFFQAYEALVKETQLPTPPVKPLFKEFIQWLQTRHREKQKKFWQNYLEGLDTPTRLPIKPLKQTRGNPGERNYRLHLHQALKDKLEVLVKEKRVTLAAVFYCAWGILLQKYGNTGDVVFGTIVSGRSATIQGIENMVGLFINTIPLRARTEPGESLPHLLARINNHLAAREKYENTPLMDIYSCCQQPTQTGQELFDSIVAVENYPLDTLKELNTQLSIRLYSMEEMPHYDLTLVISAAREIDVNFIYNNESFDRESVVRLAHHFSTVLKSIEENSESRLHEVQVLSENEKHQLLVDFNRTITDYPNEKTIRQLFEAQVERTPDNIAAVEPLEMKYRTYMTYMTYISYQELNEKSNRLAHLLQSKGVQSDTIVGIMLERSFEMVIGILGILKAGGAYLPIDPDYPEDRIDYMLKDSEVRILVKNNKNFSKSSIKEDIEIIFVNEVINNICPKGASYHPHLSPAPATSLVYVIYTSGSTGKPKGVIVQHGSVVNLLSALHHRYPLRERDTYLLKTSYLFDVSVTELFGWFLQGGRLAILEPGGEKDPKAILEMTAREGVTHINFVPSMFHTFVEILDCRDIARLPGLKYIFLAGEALLPTAVNRFRRFNTSIAIENIYGPTEATVYAGWYSLADWNGEDPIPIGKPLPNVALYIIDKWGYLQPLQLPGELHIGGEGLARGYLNNPELSNEKFLRGVQGPHGMGDLLKKITNYKIQITNKSQITMSKITNEELIKSFCGGSRGAVFSKRAPLVAEGKIYKTGDLAKWLPDGNIEFLGRMDFQVKVRGFRIELGEIENQLLNHPGVKEAVVTAQTGRTGDHFLCAYVVPFIDKPFEISQLRHYLQQKLPNYMIPAHFVMLEAIPLTAAGKIDRKSLPEPEAKSTKEYLPPGNEIERGVVKIWSDVLGINSKQIGIDDNFFELGGHSLKITTLIGRIYKELKIEVPFPGIFVRPTVRELAEYISRKEKTPYQGIPLVEEKEYYPLSSAQKRLYVLQQMDVDSVVYNLNGFMVVEGEVDKEKPGEVFQGFIARHESLRTSFHILDEETVQKIHHNVEFSIEYYDLATEAIGANSKSQIPNKEAPGDHHSSKYRIIHHFISPFDLSQAPLLRVGLVKESEHRHLLMVEMHHIISDGFSMGILIKEFMTFYQGKKLPALRLQYKDFSQWHNSSREGEGLQAQENYWLKQLQGEIPVLNLPIDFPRPVVQVFEGAHTHFRVGKEETTALQAIALEENATLFGVLASIFTIFLSRLSGQEDIVIGTPVTGRKHNDLSDVIGMFVNMLAWRNFPSGDKTFQQFLEEAGTRILEALENREYPFEDLVERLTLNRDVSRNPLFDAAFALQDPDMPRLEIPGLKVTPYEYDTRISKFDLTLIAEQVEDQLHFTLQYCTKLFKTETIERFIEYFKQLVSSIVDNPGKKISALDILPWQEKQRLLVEFNDIGADYPNDKTIPQLFREQVKRTPTNIAVVGIGQETAITYSELDEKTNQLAHLLKERGVQPDTVIGIRVERSIEMIIGILGILTAGSAYLPIDPESPEERINYMLMDSNAVLVVNQKFLRGGPGGAVFSKRAPPGRRRQKTSAKQTAYIIYTSGSSGKPKGVPITHSNFSPLIHWGYRHLGISSKDRALQNLSYYFDWSVWEIFITLTTGASLYMVSREVTMNPGVCIEFIHTHALTILHITPTHYGYLVNTGKPMKTLRYLFIGAEKLTYDLVKRSIEAVNPGCRIFNMYGPTEATIISAVLEIHPSRVDEYKELSGVPIGRPSGNTFLLVLDKYLRLCPVRSAGELYIGGEGVANGYLNNPELTAESFGLRRPGGALFEKTAPPEPPRKNFLLKGTGSHHPHSPYSPYSPHSPIYKTGDLARWLLDGNVEFLGRIDHQVKIRGYRMELGEIENHLLNYPGIKEAVVVVKGNQVHEKYLCAYIVPGNAFDQTKLKNALSKFLPDYMIPSYFIQVERMPLTPNKKIDLKALPEPTITADRDYTAPANNIEKKLVEIWSGILGIERELISTNADFFQLGGHSLKATLLAARIEKELHAKVPLSEIFITPTIRELAEFLKHAQEFKFEPIEPVEKKEYYPLPSAQRRLFILQRMEEQGIGYNIPSLWQVKGNLDVEKLERVFHQLIRRHESLRTFFTVVNDEPVQRIKEENYQKGTGGLAPLLMEPAAGSGQLAASAIKNFIRPFDLSQAPLLRVGLIKIKQETHILMVDMHHIISDELSTGIFIKEFTDLYTGRRRPALRLRYKDYSQWHNKQAESKSMKEQENYWLKQFAGELPLLNLPIDFPRPSVQGFEGRTWHFEIDDEDNLALKRIARAERTTLFMILLAFYSIFLSKICSREDIIIGTPIVCRNHMDLENIIGIFLNFLALRIFPRSEKSFLQILKEAKEQSTRALDHQDYPFEELVKRVEGDRDSSHNPIFDVMLTMQEPISPGPGIPGLKLQPYDYENQTSKLDLSLQFTEMEPKVFYRFEYSTQLFRAETIEAFSRYFKTMVSSILKNPGLRLPEIEILPAAEKKHLLIDLNQTGREYPQNKMVSGLFADQVERTPDNTAVRSTIRIQNIYDQLKPEDLEVEISYAELDESANQLAYQLRRHGVGPDSIVALMVEHPLEKIIGIWGILKSGGAYLPIDPTYPRTVIKDILSDSQVQWLVSESALEDSLTHLRITEHAYVLFIDEIEPPSIRLKPVSTPSTDNLAYIIYTSGTTGKPKGTAIKHKGIVNYAWWRIYYFQFTEKDVTLQPLTYSFDSFCGNFYPTMLSGGQLVMVPDNRRLDFDYIAGLVAEYQVTIVCMTPSLYNTLLETAAVEDLQSLRLVVLAGESTTPTLLKKSRGKVPQTQIANEYGPTEGTVAATCNPEIKENTVNMIGNPIANAKIYILNDSLQPVIPGAVGEICIAGTGVTRGYLNQPELTAEKFCLRRPGGRFLKKLPPWTPRKNFLLEGSGKRIHMSYMSHMSNIYRTGDLVRWQRNEQGNWTLEFIGRKDNQVKIRGHRIELEQVEAVLLQQDKIKEALVDMRGTGDNKYICAYVIFEEGKESCTREINEYLQERLPHYMVPSRIVRVEKFPLTPNGKIDLKALPDPDFTPGEEFEAPRNTLEQSLARLWAEVLNIREETIGIDTNFFDLGGHSLRATVLVSKIEKKMDVKIPLGHFINAPTIRELTGLINTAAPPGRRKQDVFTAVQGTFKPIKPVEKRDYYPVSSQQKRLYTLRQFDGAGTAYNVFSVHCLKGNPEMARIERSFQQLIEKHEAFRTGFRMMEGDPVQTIQDRVNWKLEYKELKNKEMAASYVKKFKREFDLSRPPLLRITILKVEEQEYLMLVDMHHIIADGVSSAILVNDLAKTYEGSELEPLTIQYKDYAVWQREWLEGSETRKQQAYWLKRYQGEIPVLNLHTDYPRPQLQSFQGSQCDFRLSPSITSKLKQICREYDVTLYMMLLACYQVLLAKYSGHDDVVVGSPVAGRDHADTEGIVGMFANTLATRSQPAGEKEFSRYLAEIKQISIEAYENQGYPFEELLEKVQITRDVSRNPLFDTMFVLQNIETEPLKMGKIEIMPYRNEPDAARFDLIFAVSEFEAELSFAVEYCTRLFKKETINRLFMHYQYILERVLKEPRKRILEIEMVTPGEKEQLLYVFNDTRAEYPTNKTIQQLFEEQVAQTPDNIAVIGPLQMKYRTYMTYISYQKLNEKSNQLAYLLKERGVQVPGIIGIMVERSIEMIIGILGILKAGSAYLPIDTEYPEERILAMLSDSGTSMLLTQGKIIDRLSVTSLKNMQTRARHQELVVTPAQTQIKNFDGLPRPDRTLVDYEKYHQYIGIAMAKHTVSLQATRGCPFNCAYCHKIWPNNHIIRSAENILEEIWPCYDAGVRRFVFIDDIFNLDKKKSTKIFESIIKQGMDLQLFFPNGMRGDILTKDFIDLMIEAGTVNIALALESASPRIQELIRKKMNLEKFEENVRYINKKYPQLLLEMEMMIGFPTETEKEALMTLEFLESLKWIHFPNLHILKIYPNTDMYKLALENGIKEELIESSVKLAYHELPGTLPFAKTFVRQYQTRFMNDYFLSKERLLQLLPLQAKILTRDEFVQKYDSYLPMKIKRFSDILDSAGISKEELGSLEFLPENYKAAPDFRKKMSKHFPSPPKTENPFRILLLDLSLFFSEQAHTTNILYDVIEEPLGLMYLVSFLNEKFKGGVWGKIAKSRIDFDSFAGLKTIISDFKPDLIGIRTLSYYREFFHNAVLRIRQWVIDVPIVAGGPYATSDYKYILKDQHVDVVVLGEGELTFAQLVEKMMENNRQLPGEEVLREIPGIAFASRANQWNQAEKNRNILLLDEITGQMSQYPVENPEHMNHPDDLLYVIYTSGSTGRPKGVMLEHGNLVNLIHYQYNYTDIDFSRVLQFTTISFDVSAQEIFSTLLAGGRLSLISKETLTDVPALFERVKKDHIKTLFLPASFLKSVINEEDFVQLIPAGVRHVVTAGEQVVINKRFRRYLLENRVYFHNHYGPTETHVVTALTLDPAGNIPELPSIGKPVSNTGIYILDKQKHLLPIGVPGELYIGGSQVGRGYLNNPQLTAERFDHDLWDYQDYHDGYHRSYKSYILYRTGDLACWLPDGNIEFLGRIDHQVKIRGFRVELGEIESRLLDHPGIKDTVVQARVSETGERYLCAYIVAPDPELSVSELREYLSRGLPGYMIPSYFVPLDKIPLTPNGKIDRKALPAPGMEAGDRYEAPRDEIEKKLLDIWTEILGIEKEKISVDANFFHLGGHSLKATVLFSRVHKEFNVNIPLTEIFNTPQIRGLAAYIQEAGKSKYIPIEPVEKKDYYPLSSAQRRLYILQQIDDGQGIGYNIPSVWQLEGNLDAGKFAAVFQQLIQRHESLRTSFILVNDKPVQRIKEENYKLQITNPSARGHYKEGTRGLAPLLIEPATGNWQLATSNIKNFIRPFNLSQAPLLRVGLIKMNEQTHILMVDMHHIISDGVSIDIFIKEFINLYAGKRLPDLRLQYRDYTGWQSQQVRGERIKQQETYWIKEFAGEVPVLDLPTDFTRPSMQSFVGGSICFETGKKETAALKSLAHKQNVTLFMLLLSIYNVFLSKLSSQEDIVVGTPIAGRRHTDLEAIIGMFVNTLALRNFPLGQITFIQFLEAVKERTIKAFDYQDYLYEDLVEQVTVERDTGRNPLFDTMFALQNPDTHAIEIPGLNVTPYLNETPISKFDLTLTAVEGQENLFFTFEYCSKLFKKETIRRFIGYYNQVISRIVENHAIKLSEIEIIDEKEKNRVLYEFNNTAADYPKDKTIHQLFEEQVEQTPDHTALVGQIPNSKSQIPNKEAAFGDDVSLTYKELNEKSDQLAHLLSQKSVGPDTIVGIMMERSIEMIIGILGILKSGGAYLPIDPGYPPGRIQYMLKDSGAKILLKDNDFTPGVFNNRPKGTSSHLHLPPAPATSLAYIIYTSGSTGKPKGVMIGHKAVNNFITGITGKIPFKPGKVLLAVTTICFDIHILETLLPLWRGMQVVVADEQQQRDGNLLAAAILKHHIDMLQVTPSRMRMLPGVGHGHDVSCLKHLKEIMVGGEPFPVELLEKLKKLTSAIIYNMYGPTETTVWSAVEDLTHVDKITIGRPIANTQVYILDKKQNLQPVGIAGELSIGGDGIARGYINQPGLTCEKFKIINYKLKIKNGSGTLRADLNAFGEGKAHKLHELPEGATSNEKLLRGVQGGGFLEKSPPGRRRQVYKTGDLARWLMDGRIEFFGRIDNQVKIRGFRIELGEIESQLLTHEKIKEAVVIDREDSSSNKCLCAYLVLIQGEINTIDQAEFRGYLTNRLPDYMVPSFFVQLDKIPLTPNGKIDRKALPAPGIRASDNYEAPGSELEKRLVEIWQAVLGVEQVGINDNFFQLGGHSLKAIQIVSLFEKEGIHMNVGDLFRYGNIKTLVEIKSVPREPYRENEFIEQTVEKIERCTGEEKENILEMLEKSIREFNNAILEGKVIKSCPLSAMQKAYLRLSRRSTGALMAFNGYPSQDRLCDAIIKTTAEQGLLRSRIVKEDSDLLWYEHEMPENLEVPFVDLSQYSIEVTEEITRMIAARYFPNRDINVTILPYSVILIKKNMRDHLLVFAADHTIYDALTGQILQTNLENFYHHRETLVKMGTPTIRGYDEYVNQVNKGPQQVNQDKIIRTFELEEFRNSMAEVNRVFKANRSNRFVNHEITIPLKDITGHFDGKMPLEISLRIYVSLCKAFFGVEKVPLLFFTFGRKYQDKEFFDTVGEFTDLVPILVNSHENILAKIEEKIAFASKYNINFMTTLMNEEKSAKWKKVTALLSPDGIGYDRNLLRFNFTGKTADIEPDQLKEHSKNMEIKEHPPINDVELDGVTVMASNNNERLKIEVGFNMEVDQAEFRESIRVITRQMEDLKDLALV